MKKLALAVCVALLSTSSFAQVSTVSNNKPMGFLNPALQNYEMDNGVFSFSSVVSPLIDESQPASLLGIAEFKVNNDFRVGIHASNYENRLSKSASAMLYASYRLELEKGNYLILGADFGGYSDLVKAAEFNKVLIPNNFIFDNDSALEAESTGVDFGFGIAYSYSGFTFGMGFSKLNKPAVYPFPLAYYELGPDTVTYILKDTTMLIEEGTFGLETNVNLIYEWQANKKLKLIHSLHLGNIDFAGFDYLGFQNIAEINKRHSIGVGAFHNGSTGFILSGGFGFSEKLKIEATAFISEDDNYDIIAKEYKSSGYKPAFEANLRYQF